VTEILNIALSTAVSEVDASTTLLKSLHTA